MIPLFPAGSGSAKHLCPWGHAVSGIIVSKMALNPSAIAILPFCALGILVSAGGADWPDVGVGFVDAGFDVEDCAEVVALTLPELVVGDPV